MPTRIEIVSVESKCLAGNPLGDPTARELGVILPPSYDASPDRHFPMILMLPGFTSTGLALVNRGGFTEPLDRRLDRLCRTGAAKEAILVLPDCFTRYGGSQYVDSPALGAYQRYLCDEVVPLVDRRFRTLPQRESRAVLGKSSGGYGAIALALARPDLFSAFGSHAGDSAFELSYQREFGRTAMTLERRGGIDGFLRHFEAQPTKSGGDIEALSNLCCAAAWSPRPSGPYGFGVGFDLPFHPRTGVLVEEVWARWLTADPVRRFAESAHLETLARSSAIFLDAGLGDEYNLQLGARLMSERLTQARIAHVHEEFEGGHMNTPHRYDRSIAVLSAALAN
jgi:enterochelin esterase family protein